MHGRSLQANSDGERLPISTHPPFVKHITLKFCHNMLQNHSELFAMDAEELGFIETCQQASYSAAKNMVVY